MCSYWNPNVMIILNLIIVLDGLVIKAMKSESDKCKQFEFLLKLFKSLRQESFENDKVICKVVNWNVELNLI